MIYSIKPKIKDMLKVNGFYHLQENQVRNPLTFLLKLE